MISPDTSHPYQPPSWALKVLKNIPKHGRLHLANLPTPLHLVDTKSSRRKRDTNKDDNDGILSKLDEFNIKLYIKRDDATGKSALVLLNKKSRRLGCFIFDHSLSSFDCLYKPHILTEVISSS